MAHASDAVAQIVEQAARRIALIEAVPLALGLAGAVLLAAAVAQLLVQSMIGQAPFWPFALAAVLGALVVVVQLRTASRPRAARLLDHELRLGEAVSTAYELGDRGNGPVLRALRGRADALAGQVDVRRLGRWRSRTMLLAAGFLAIAALVAAAVALRPTVHTGAATPTTEVSDEAPRVTADALDTLAKLLADDAERKNSDYLAAVSRSVEQLAEQVKAGLSPEDVTDELQALLDHAKAGYEGQVPSWLQDGANDLQNVLRSAADTAEARRQSDLARAAKRSDPQQAGGLSSEMYKLDPSVLDRSAAELPAGNPDPAKAGGEREGTLDGGPAGGGDFAARKMESEQLEQAGALPVGGAAQSGKGESNVAGGGSQPLLNDAGFLKSMPDPTSEMALSAADPQEDGHIRIFVPTGAEAHDAAGAGGGAAAYARQAAQAVDRQAVSGDATRVVSRYFNSAAEGAVP